MKSFIGPVFARFRASPILLAFSAAVVLSAGCASNPLGTPSKHPLAAPGAYEGEPSLQINLPPDFRMRMIRGVDFDVLYYTSAQHRCSLTIYIGFHPALRARLQPPESVSHEAGLVGTLPVEWARWSDQNGMHSETLVRGLYGQPSSATPGGPAALLVHVFTSAQSAGEIARLETAASNMELVAARLRPAPATRR